MDYFDYTEYINLGYTWDHYGQYMDRYILVKYNGELLCEFKAYNKYDSRHISEQYNDNLKRVLSIWKSHRRNMSIDSILKK